MLLNCLKVQALFPREKIRLEHEGPAPLLVDEHGGALILKVGDLKSAEITEPGGETGLFLEVDLLPGETVVQEIEGFAAAQSLPLTPIPTPAPACRVLPILAACHLPGPKKFIFAEESRLEARPGKTGSVEITVKGEFRASPVPSREGDLVIHLRPGDLAQLLSYLAALAREAQ